MNRFFGSPILLLTFPGAILHAFWHSIICKSFKIPINEINFFDFKKFTCYVVHERSENQSFNKIVTFLPFLLSSLVGISLLIASSIEFGVFNLIDIMISGGTMWASTFEFIILVLSLWLGISCLVHAVPSGKIVYMYINSVKDNVSSKPENNRYLGAPYIAHTTFIGLVYAFLIVLGIPKLIEFILI